MISILFRISQGIILMKSSSFYDKIIIEIHLCWALGAQCSTIHRFFSWSLICEAHTIYMHTQTHAFRLNMIIKYY